MLGERGEASPTPTGPGVERYPAEEDRREVVPVRAVPPRSRARPQPGPTHHTPGRGSKARRRKRRALRRRLRRLSRSLGRSWTGWLSHPELLCGLLLLSGFVAIGIVAPLFYPSNPGDLTTDNNVFVNCTLPSGPTLQAEPFVLGTHPLGQTAHLGLDVAQGLLLGTRWDLLLVASIVAASAVIGALLGAMAGAMGGWVETTLSPVFDGVLAFPPILVVIVVLAVTTPSTQSADRIFVFVLAMVVVLWAPFAQGIRAQARSIARSPFVEAAKAAGARWPRILVRHVLPNCSSTLLAQVPSTVFSILFVLGAYQYLGLVSDPVRDPVCGVSIAGGRVWGSVPQGYYLLVPNYRFPEWTWVLANGAAGYNPSVTFLPEWWAYLVPVAWIALFLLAVTLVCDGLVGLRSSTRRI